MGLIGPLLCLTLSLMLAAPAGAVRVDDLYSSTVGISADARDPLNDAFGRALDQVLMKVTGQPGAGQTAGLSIRRNPGALVQQYTRLPQNRLRARFDAKAIRAALDSAGLPVWGEVRPLVATWVAVDSGGGRRVIVSEGAGKSLEAQGSVDALRIALTATADSRGLPIVFPLVDAVDLRGVSFTDIWGNFREPVVQASERYRAEAVLIGRARSLNPSDDRTRWTLRLGNEELNWTGDINAGPAKAAEYLAQRLATFADAADTLRVRVRDVDTLDKYGQLQKYFASLNIVERAAVARVNANEVEFDLVVRGDVRRLEATLNRSRLLQAVDSDAADLEFGRVPDLIYGWQSDN